MIPADFFINWFKARGREFPWRDEGVSSFALLITEMLLRQTRAEMVARVWPEFVRNYPDPERVASANRKILKAEVEGLGFGKQRSEALQLAAQWLLDHHGGAVPDTEAELLKIPHVGPYTARAMLCFAFDHRVAVVDLNILRFLSRYYSLQSKPDIRRSPEVWERAENLLPLRNRSTKQHNYGLLDFNAEICKPRNPQCSTCPIATGCRHASR
jgi:A/G-specific adenine glycosylase